MKKYATRVTVCFVLLILLCSLPIYSVTQNRPYYFTAIKFLISNKKQITSLESALSEESYTISVTLPFLVEVPDECDVFPFSDGCSYLYEELFIFERWERTKTDSESYDWVATTPADPDQIYRYLFHPLNLISYFNSNEIFSVNLASTEDCGSRQCWVQILRSKNQQPEIEFCRDTDFPNEVISCVYRLFGDWYIYYDALPEAVFDPMTGEFLRYE